MTSKNQFKTKINVKTFFNDSKNILSYLGLGELKCLDSKTSGDLNIEGYDGCFKVGTCLDEVSPYI